MTYEEAIKIFKNTSCATQKARQALVFAIEALEKQVPKKPKCRLYHSDARCPVCNMLTVFELKYCHECGQALNWSDEE